MASVRNTKKTTNGRKKRANTAKQQSIKEHGVIQDEIILVLMLVVSVLLFLSNFDLSGNVGKFVSDIVFGIIGLEAYILPIVIFFVTAFHISNQGNKRAGRKIISAIVFLVALAALIELITNGFDKDRNLFQYFIDSHNLRNGGGFIGGIFVLIFCSLFADIATYIILIAVMLISVIVITGKAIITILFEKSKNTLQERKEYQKIKKEQQELTTGISATEVASGRRPPKTFVLNPNEVAAEGKTKDTDNVVSIKHKQSKKGQSANTDELPILNFDHLFEDENQKANGTRTGKNLFDMGQAGTVPTYEEELRNKFGKTGVTDSFDHEDELPKQDLLQQGINEHGMADYDKSKMMSPEMVNQDIHSHDTGVERQSGNDEIRGTEGKHAHENKSTDVEKLDINQVTEQKRYIFPSLNLLTSPKPKTGKNITEKGLKETAMKLQSTLESFGVHVTVTNVSCGPAVTRYELQPEQGVKVSRITSLADDIKLNLAASDVRIEAPIPGKAAVGIEVPNKENSMVTLREMLESKEFTDHPSDIAFAVGRDIGGQTIITDIAKMPHLLIAGATGSGKSVCINTLIMSILYKSNPSDVRLIMVDPKVVELNVYNGIPHLLIPVVTDPKKASAALNWAVMEMTERYKKFADLGVRDLKGYNEKVAEVAYLNDENYQKLPQIVIIIDELADLMMVAQNEVEDAICRLAQLARAAGLHLVIATQRPSVNVITGLIKANIPSRIAFAVSSAIDSRTILDGSGAEKLLGKGDMLFFPSGYPKPVRIQGAFISDKEVSAVVDFIKTNNTEAQYSEQVKDHIVNAKNSEGALTGGNANEQDDYFAEAGKFIIEKDKASIGMLQRVYKIGFNRAARIMDQLAEAGVVGPEEGTKPRKILMSQEQFEQFLEEN
ncbi:MAG: cell division FtsK/SpoIIIE [Herbinix sp.]|jgi:S-DNA-T family DNA segregation ATPase FtsK/SpoIIIE|nr:cell division FtsK/SpoIIIE [Herbinix sp.]